MEWKKEWKKLLILTVGFLVAYHLPVEYLQGWSRLKNAVWESLYLTRYYAREHVILCLIPAFFIAGAIGVFISQAAVMKYLGAGAKKTVAYGVAAVSGTVLAVCSCTVLPLFAGIYKMGAGLGPAVAFLYSGPAINVLAIILTARILGPELGIARAVGAIVFSVAIGLLMHLIFRHEEGQKAAGMVGMPEPEVTRPLWQNGVFFAVMVLILVFANWGKPGESEGLWFLIHSWKWIITSLFSLVLAAVLVIWIKLPFWKIAVTGAAVVMAYFITGSHPNFTFAAGVVGLSWTLAGSDGEGSEWFEQTWGFTWQIMPLLLGGVLVAGFLLGRPDMEGIIPSRWVIAAVGGNSLTANFFASIAGAFMYFATLTEVPILQGLIGAGMGNGPALALLLAGPALSLPNMLVIRSVMGTKKTVVFVTLVVVMATISGMIFGTIYG